MISIVPHQFKWEKESRLAMEVSRWLNLLSHLLMLIQLQFANQDDGLVWMSRNRVGAREHLAICLVSCLINTEMHFAVHWNM